MGVNEIALLLGAAIAVALGAYIDTVYGGVGVAIAFYLLAILSVNISGRRGMTLFIAFVVSIVTLGPSLLTADNLPPLRVMWLSCIWLATAILIWDPRRSHLAIAQLREAFAQAPTGFALMNLDGQVVMANTTLANIVGRSGERLKGKSLRDLVGNEVWQAIIEKYDVLASGESLEIEYTIERPDGASVRVSGYSRLIHDTVGKPNYYLVQLLDISERHAIEAARKGAESRFRNVTHYSADLILIVDTQGRISHANPRAQHVLGKDEAALLGARATELFHPADRATFARMLVHSTQNPERLQQLEQLRLDASTEAHVDARFVGLPVTPGIEGTVVTCRVITDRVQSMRKLRASEARFSRIFHSSPDAILIVRREDSMILDFNEGFTRLLGYSREAAIGQQESDLGFWIEEKQRLEVLRELQQYTEVIDRETRLRTADGRIVHVEISLRFIEIDGDICILCIGRDITKRIAAEAALKDSEEKFGSVFAHSPDGIVMLRLLDGSIYDINDAFIKASGFSREELVDKSVADLPIFADRDEFLDSANLLARDGHYANFEMIFKTRDGEQIPALVSATTFELSGELFAVCIAKDMRELRTTEERLRRSEERFRGAFENAPIGIILIDLEGQIFQANRFSAELLAYDEKQMPGLHISRLVPTEDRQGLKDQLQRLANPISSESSRIERRLVCQNGLEIWTNFHVVLQRGLDGEPLYSIVQIADITDTKLSQRRMERMAFYDTLTDLANRRLFQDRLRQAIDHSERTQRSAALLYLDLDQFKRVNDTLGHEAGDHLLRDVAHRLTQCVRKEDTVARPGGDEFTILLYDVQSPADAGQVADKVLTAMREPLTIHGQKLVVTTSIGITMIPADGVETNSLMKNADLAMYRAKEQGRNNFQFYSEGMNADAKHRLRTENELRAALEKDQFELHYQPKVQLSDQRTVGVEALIRWQHPERGLLLPSEFVEVAEDTGVIIDIGNWIIQTACDAARSLADKHQAPLTMGVNLSPRQFRDPSLVNTVRRSIRKSRIDPATLELEITETMLMHDVDAASETVHRLHELGVRLAIDKFGTGYSSLNYLKKFPIDTVKIDRRFIMDIPHNTDDMEITAAVIAMAHRLNMAVVAEGVETTEQLDFLVKHDCEYAQGYLFSKAQPLRKIRRLVAPNVRMLRGE